MIFKRMGADITRNVSAASDNILSISRCSLLEAAADFLATTFLPEVADFFAAGLTALAVLVLEAVERFRV